MPIPNFLSKIPTNFQIFPRLKLIIYFKNFQYYFFIKNHKIKNFYNKLEFHTNQSTNIDRKPFSNYKCDGSRTHFCSKTLCINQLQWYFI